MDLELTGSVVVRDLKEANRSPDGAQQIRVRRIHIALPGLRFAPSGLRMFQPSQ
jgi:hypothetical protein